MNIDKQLRIITSILVLKDAWFWTSIWLLYYLLFTNYQGVGVIETVMIGVGFFIEIPTGAVSDLLGRKKTLSLGLFTFFAGLAIMTVSQNFYHLLFSIVLVGFGGAFISGTDQAIVYDSLLNVNQKERFDSVISSITKYTLITLAFTSFVGSYMYNTNPRLPFLLTSVAIFIAFILSFFLVEPEYEKETFSLKNYLKQTKFGFAHIFKKINAKTLAVLLLCATLALFLQEYMDDAILVGAGHTNITLGWYYLVSILIGAAVAGFYVKIKKLLKMNPVNLSYLLAFIAICLCIILPQFGFFLATISVAFRGLLYKIFDLAATEVINEKVESKYRATAISSFITIAKTPYLLFAVAIGSLIDRFSASNIAFWLGIIYLALFAAVGIFYFSKRKGV